MSNGDDPNVSVKKVVAPITIVASILVLAVSVTWVLADLKHDADLQFKDIQHDNQKLSAKVDSNHKELTNKIGQLQAQLTAASAGRWNRWEEVEQWERFSELNPNLNVPIPDKEGH